MESSREDDHLNEVIRDSYKVWREKYWQLAGKTMMECSFSVQNPLSGVRCQRTLQELYDEIGHICQPKLNSDPLEIVANAAFHTFILLEADRIGGRKSMETSGLEALDLFMKIGRAIEQTFFAEKPKSQIRDSDQEN